MILKPGSAPASDRFRVLRALPELARFNAAELRSLLPYFDEVTVEPGSVLARRGEPCREYLVVVEGRLEALYADLADTLEAGASSGWAPMWELGRNPATLRARTAARLLVMGRAQFRAVTALAAGRARSRSINPLDGCTAPTQADVAGSTAGAH